MQWLFANKTAIYLPLRLADLPYVDRQYLPHRPAAKNSACAYPMLSKEMRDGSHLPVQEDGRQGGKNPRIVRFFGDTSVGNFVPTFACGGMNDVI
jgi:hypothetical protein